MWSGLMAQYSPLQFALVRIVLGFYLSFYFLRILPYSAETFSHAGLVSQVSLNPTYSVTFWFITYFTSPLVVLVLIWCGLVASAVLIVGVVRHFAALYLWFCWLVLFNLNNYTDDPSLAFIGLLLLIFAITPSGEPLVFKKRFLTTDGRWYMPAITYWGSWAIFAISFTISGIEKFAGPLWRSGEAFGLLLAGPVALDNFLIDWLSLLPMTSILLLTWLTLYSQLFAIVLVLHAYSRFVLWLVSTVLFIAALPILDLLEVLLGMIVFFLFLFDAGWFTSKKHITVWIDSECPACSYFAKLIKSENSLGTIAISNFFDPQLRTLISDEEIKAMKEMVVFDGERIYRGDEALILALVHIGGMWNLCRLLYVLPKSVRKKLYQVLARNRYRFKVCSV